MSDLQALVAEVTKEVEDSGFIRETIKKHLQKSLDESIASMFRSYGTFGKALEKKIEGELVVNLSQLSLAAYGDIILGHVRRVLDDQIAADAVVKLEKLVGKHLTKLDKTEWKLSEIIEKYKEGVSQYRLEREGQIAFEADESEYTPNHYYIGFEEERSNTGSVFGGKKSRYEMKYQLSIREDGTLSDFSINKRSPQQQMATGVDIHGFDAFLFNLYANQVKITVDVDEVILDWGSEHE